MNRPVAKIGTGAAGRFAAVASGTRSWHPGAMQASPRRLVLQGLALAAACALALLIAGRTTILSGFELGFGDRGDSPIEIAVLEHWRNVLMGAEGWSRPIFFHPHAGALGYNDGYLLYGIVYSFWRLFFDPFVADSLNVLTFKTIGFLGAYALGARTLGWRPQVALLVALLFTVSNNIVVQTRHQQVALVALLPVAMMLAAAAWRAERDGRQAHARLLGAAWGALMAAWLSTGFYFAWFALFFALVLAGCWAGVTGTWRPRRAIALLRPHLGTLAVVAGVSALLLLPFLSVYLPKVWETGGHGVTGVKRYLITPVDWINVGPGNLLWGWTQAPLATLAGAAGVEGEHQSGFPLILFGLYVGATVRVLRRDGGFLKAFALAIAISWLLTLKLGPLSPWQAVYEIVPGARGLRVVLRYQLFLALPVLLLVFAAFRARIEAMLASAPLAAAGLALLLVAEQVNADTGAEMPRSLHLAELETVPRPPPGCASFYVVTARPHEPLFREPRLHRLYPHNVDAMYLAERWRVPTVNGFSTFNPPGWNFADPLAADYDARVLAHADAHGLHGLCRLDMRDVQPWRRIGPTRG